MMRSLLLGLSVALVLGLASVAEAGDCSCCWFHKLHRDACPPYRLMPSPTTLTHTKPPCEPGTPCCLPYQGPQPCQKFYFPQPDYIWAKKIPHCLKY